MHSINELCENDAFKARLANAFIPNSAQLTAVWGTDSNEWGNNNVRALLSLEKWIGKDHKAPLTQMQVYKAAAHLRAEIAKKMTADPNYAILRSTYKPGYLSTRFTPSSRYKDQFGEGLHFITQLPQEHPNLARANVTAATSLYPFAQTLNDRGEMVTLPGKPINHVNIQIIEHHLSLPNNKIKLANIKSYYWIDEEAKTGIFSYEILNPYSKDIVKIFNHMQSLELDLWNTQAIDDTQFYDKLANWVWLMAQTSPLLNGSASTTELLMKYFLLKRFGEEAPLFSKAGLSWDIMAMLTTRETFVAQFRTLLISEREPAEQIAARYNIPFTRQAYVYLRKQNFMANAHIHQQRLIRDNGSIRMTANPDEGVPYLIPSPSENLCSQEMYDSLISPAQPEDVPSRKARP